MVCWRGRLPIDGRWLPEGTGGGCWLLLSDGLLFPVGMSGALVTEGRLSSVGMGGLVGPLLSEGGGKGGSSECLSVLTEAEFGCKVLVEGCFGVGLLSISSVK